MKKNRTKNHKNWMQVFPVRLTAEAIKQLKKTAKQNNTTPSAIVRRIVNKHLSKPHCK